MVKATKELEMSKDGVPEVEMTEQERREIKNALYMEIFLAIKVHSELAELEKERRKVYSRKESRGIRKMSKGSRRDKNCDKN